MPVTSISIACEQNNSQQEGELSVAKVQEFRQHATYKNNPAGSYWIDLSVVTGLSLYDIFVAFFLCLFKQEPIQSRVNNFFCAIFRQGKPTLFILAEDGWFGKLKYSAKIDI